MTWPWIVLFAVLWISVIVLAALVTGLSQRLGQLESVIGVQDSGSILPSARELVGHEMPTVDHYEELLFAEGIGRGLILLFLSASCAPCLQLGRDLMDEVEHGEGLLRKLSGVELAVVTDEPGSAIYRPIGDTMRVITEQKSELSTTFGVPAVPFGFAVDGDRVVRGAELLAGMEDIEKLIGIVTPRLPTETWP